MGLPVPIAGEPLRRFRAKIVLIMAMTAGGMGQRVAHPVHPTALLAGVEHLAGGGAQSLVIVGDDQLHPAQAAIR